MAFFFPKNDELSMKVTKTIKKLQFIKWTWDCSHSTMLVNIWLFSAFTDPVSWLAFVHFLRIEHCQLYFLKVFGIYSHYIPHCCEEISDKTSPRKDTLAWAHGIMVHCHGEGKEQEVKASSLFSMKFTLSKHISSLFIVFVCRIGTLTHA